MNYGIKPYDLRIFEIAGREIGEIYHNCIMFLSKKINDDSSWNSITKEECDKLVNSFIDGETATYKEGMMATEPQEMYRADRIKSVCRENVWILVRHVRAGNIYAMDFEKKFAAPQGGPTALPAKNEVTAPPIEVKTRVGKKVLIEGRIDRVDILADGSVKIIDYKSGSEKFSVKEAKAGWRLQLMLYLKAAQGPGAQPAGVFYFTIDEGNETGRMDGVAVDKVSVIENIAGEFEAWSEVIPIRKLKDGGIKGNSGENLLSESEFAEFREAVDKKIRDMCGELVEGCIDIRPKRSGNVTACTYCGYKSVCTFDAGVEGFVYENI